MIIYNLFLIFLLKFIPKISSTLHPPFYPPCKFPTPEKSKTEYFTQCVVSPQIPYICDLHKQISHSSVSEINDAYLKHENVFKKYLSNDNKTSIISLGIIIVKQLLAPHTSKQVYNNHDEYGCLFQDDCSPVMDAETVERFVNSYRVFTRIFSSAVYKRWFPRNEKDFSSNGNDGCNMNNFNILVLVVLDGMVGDNRKLPSVTIHTDNTMLSSFLSNIQLETTNAINQNWPLHQVIADLVDQIGFAMRSFYKSNGKPLIHEIPPWAYRLSIFCIVMVIIALFIEWYIVRRKLAVKRNITGTKIESIKSKTHIMFGGN